MLGSGIPESYFVNGHPWSDKVEQYYQQQTQKRRCIFMTAHERPRPTQNIRWATLFSIKMLHIQV